MVSKKEGKKQTGEFQFGVTYTVLSNSNHRDINLGSSGDASVEANLLCKVNTVRALQGGMYDSFQCTALFQLINLAKLGHSFS